MKIISDLRLELLEVGRSEALIRALYGLLMILPQSEAFGTLHRRLAAIPPKEALREVVGTNSRSKSARSIDFDKLLKHFVSIQEKHKEQKLKQRQTSLIERDVSHLEI